MNKLNDLIKQMPEAKKEDDNGFIFDKDRIIKKLHFAIGIFRDQHYVGVLLPKNELVEVSDKKLKISFKKTIQRQVPVIVLDNNTYFEIKPSFEELHNVKFSEPILLDQPRWDLDEMKFYLDNISVKGDKFEAIKPIELFSLIKSQYKKYCYLDDDFYLIHSLWDIGTYFFYLFEAYPYFELNGLKGTGKTKVMKISEMNSFNGQMFISPTPATLFRYVSLNKPTLYIDEAEKLFRGKGKLMESDDIVELLNAGYKKGGKVPRVEKSDVGKFEIKSFDVYCPKMLASIKGLEYPLKDRCIVEVLTKPPKDDQRGDLEPSENDGNFQRIRNHLYPFCLKEAKAVSLIYHTLLKEFSLTNRNWQKWKPLLAIAKHISQDLYLKVGKIAEKQTLIEEESLEEDSFDYKIILSLIGLVENTDGLVKIKVSEIKKNVLFDDEGVKKPSNHYVGRYINKLGFNKFRKRTGQGVFYELTKEDVLKIIESQNLITQTTLTTLITQKVEEISLNEEDKSGVI